MLLFSSIYKFFSMIKDENLEWLENFLLASLKSVRPN